MYDQHILAIERPHPNLLKLYIIRAILTGPLLFFTLPYLYFRYHTMRYRFDDEGLSMSWGLLFRHQINLTYARIQDIHLVSGIIQRWLGLCDIKIQTASGSAEAEMSIEGLLEYEAIRDFLYARMRGAKGESVPDRGQAPAVSAASEAMPEISADETAELLRALHADLRATREALETLAARRTERHE